MLTHTKSVTDRLRDMLLEGTYRPGAHLQEIPLAEELGVSRTPVRAALAALEREGLLDYAPKRGFAVRRISQEEIGDKFRVRSVLEGFAAGQCALLGLTDEQIAVLDACVADGDAMLSSGRLQPRFLPNYRRMNNIFHSTIIEGSRSSATAEHVLQISQIPFLSDRIILWDDYRLIERSHDDHHRVLDAIRHRDPQRAEALMREHVHFMGLTILRHLEADAPGQLASLLSGNRGEEK